MIPATLRQILRKLQSLPTNPGYDEIENMVEKLGGKYLAQGAFSYCFQIGNYVLKVGYDDFSMLRRFVHEDFFKRVAPKVYWIHKRGWACLCEFIKYTSLRGRKSYYTMRRKMERFLNKQLEPFNLECFDLHPSNMVKVGKHVKVIDYGCFLIIPDEE